MREKRRGMGRLGRGFELICVSYTGNTGERERDPAGLLV